MTLSAKFDRRTSLLTLEIEDDGAQYIAEVMHEEYGRTHDRGALAIANEIEAVMGRR